MMRGYFLFINGPLDGQRHEVDFKDNAIIVETQGRGRLPVGRVRHFYAKIGASFVYHRSELVHFA